MSPMTDAPRAVTPAEAAVFEYIRDAPHGAVALIRTTYDGREASVICAIVHPAAEDDDVIVEPLAILVTDAMSELIADPFAGDQPSDSRATDD